MIDIAYAKEQFYKYLSQFDCEHDKIKLKIIHTEGVISCAREIALRMGLSSEDVSLAELIALLHDIGRFEQIKQYDSFEPSTMDHASFGVDYLFGEKEAFQGRKRIRDYIKDDSYDEIIKLAIAQHSLYVLEEIEDERMLLHARLIRDADKLDNCRVKLEESLEVLLGMDAETVGRLSISKVIWDSCMRQESIRSEERITKMDYWVSYLAYFFDINYKETWELVRENHYIDRIIDRITYTNPDTKEKMETLRLMLKKKANGQDYTYYFFDLDGTLTDPGIGITNAIMYSLAKYDIHVEDRALLYPFIGPPLKESYMKYYHFSEEQADEAIRYYREYFRAKGIFENVLYDGTLKMLAGLKERGKKIILATSKPEEFAYIILEHFGLMPYFDYVGGASMDGKISKKKDVIAHVIKTLGIDDKEQILMIGDRDQDIMGAKVNGLSSAGVLYGYGDYEELSSCGADYILEKPEDILLV